MWSRMLLGAAVLLCSHQVHGKRVPCDLDDTECLTESVKRVVVKRINGGFPELPRLDPLHSDLVQGVLPTINYTLRDVTFAGINSCVPELLRRHGPSVLYTLGCPHLSLDGTLDIRGQLHSLTIDGHGPCKVDYYDYAFLFTMECEEIVKDDKKLYLKLKSYTFDIDVRGKVQYEAANLYDGDADKSAAILKYINDNWRAVDEMLRQPVLSVFLGDYMHLVDAFFDKYPLEEHFYYETD